MHADNLTPHAGSNIPNPAAMGLDTDFAKKQLSLRQARDFFKANPDAISIDELLRYNLPVYVQNNLSSPGRIIVDFNINGTKESIVIPNSWLPINLNERMTPDDINRSGSLRNHIRKGSLVLLHPDDAEAHLRSDRGVREMAKYRSLFAKPAGVAVAELKKSNTSAEVSDRVKTLVARLQETSVGSAARQDALDTLFNNARTMSEADALYIGSMANGDNAVSATSEEILAVIRARK